MKNKLFQLLLILLLSVVCLTACNKTPTPEPENPTGSEGEKTELPTEPIKTPTPTVPATKLGIPRVTIDETGLAKWGAVVNATEYAYQIDSNSIQKTTNLSVKLTDGQSIRVKALGDGTKFLDGDFCAAIKYTAPVAEEHIDYATEAKLDFSSDSIKAEVSVKLFVDGDTTHFNIKDSTFDGGVLKARYLAVNTPESTGKVEAWGKTAANFTKSKLSNATSIVVESDTYEWTADSTGGRFLVWVWYKTSESEEYRNLNIELLQEGLSIASNSEQNRYGKICGAAIAQARREKLNVYSGGRDPNFYYGAAQELTLKELRTNVEQYEGQKVAFEGVVYRDYSETVYIEEYDEETGRYYGMTVYYGYSASGVMLDILKVGNRVRIVGTVSLYEAAGTYQVSGLSYREMKPNDPGNIQKIGEGYSGAYDKITAAEFTTGKVTVETETEEGTVSTEYPLAKMLMNTSVSMDNLVVKSIYTTTNEESSSKGAMTLTCEVNGITVTLRTVVLKDANGDVITDSAYQGKTISVKGMVDYYDGEYQIKIFSANDITIH